MHAILLIVTFLCSLSYAEDPKISVSEPWTVRKIDEGQWTFHSFKHPAHVTLSLRPEKFGVSLTYENRTMDTPLDHRTEPLIAPTFSADALSKVEIETQGIDLVIRLEGPPLHEWTGQPSAPNDPVISWTRVRVRGKSWRFILRGLQRWNLPASPEGPHPKPSENEGFSFTHGFGSWSYRTNAKALSGQKTRDHWYIDTSGSVWVKDPYPTTVIDWTPSIESPHREPNTPQPSQNPPHPVEKHP